MNFDDFKSTINLSLSNEDYNKLVDELHSNAINGKVNDSTLIFSVIRFLEQKQIELLEKYHEWLMENSKR